MCIKVNKRKIKIVWKIYGEMRLGHLNPLIYSVWYTAPISHEYFSSFMMVN